MSEYQSAWRILLRGRYLFDDRELSQRSILDYVNYYGE